MSLESEIRKADYNDPLTRLLCAPAFAHMKKIGIKLSPEMDSIAGEDSQELREFRGEQYAEKIRRSK